MQPDQPQLHTIERIVLIGFMGAGKSTVGPILADRLGWRFVDADHELETETGTTIAQLFTTHGEPGFRELEAGVVARLLRHHEIVIALGGGAIESALTRSVLSASTSTCITFLKAPLNVLIRRCEEQPNAAVRPILQQKDALERRFLGRLPHYEAAHLTVDTEGLAPQAVAEQLLHKLSDASFAIPLSQKVTAL
jgi:shikimate kinase